MRTNGAARRMLAAAATTATTVALLLTIGAAGSDDLANPDIAIRNVDRTIDLGSQLTNVTSKIQLENNGKSAIGHFVFAIEEKRGSRLSSITALTREAARNELGVEKLSAERGGLYYRIALREPLQPGRTTVVRVETISSHEIEPYPRKIAQKDKQLVRYTGNVYLYSPYVVDKQTTTFVLPSRNVESFSRVQPCVQNDAGVVYGPYDARNPWEERDVTVHFENNDKFLTVARLVRVAEISHWGNIAVEETIDLVHTGALLEGSFSRYEYSRESKLGRSSVGSFDSVLPAAATDIYYRDDIGNISTSHARVRKDSVRVNLRPRFPLFGGWKTRYVIGYNLPSYEYLFHSGDKFALEMRLLDHVFDDMVVDELLLRIVLPEGAADWRLVVPYDVERLDDSSHRSYLDVGGRPVVSVLKRNLVENHIKNFRLTYDFPRVLVLREPLLVACALYLLFLLVVAYVRMDFSIDRDEASESKLRIAGRCEKILAAQDRRVASYDRLDDRLASLKASKDSNAFLAAVKSINREYKIASGAIEELAAELRSDSAEVWEKVQELQKVDRRLKELYNQRQTLYVEKLVPGKIARPEFVHAEAAVAKKKEEIVEKINSIVKSLQ